jgi:hypothetical protein
MNKSIEEISTPKGRAEMTLPSLNTFTCFLSAGKIYSLSPVLQGNLFAETAKVKYYR